MPPTPTVFTERNKEEMRRRFGQVRILIADHDIRIASLVRRVLASFGFANAELVSSGERAFDRLQKEHFDLIVTEKTMEGLDGIELVKRVRGNAEEGPSRRDIPIIMLTAHSEKASVEAARDAGITEFLAKPFSAGTISTRLIQVIDNPRPFVESHIYIGPCRRRRGEPPPGMRDRRGTGVTDTIMSAPNTAIRDSMGGNAAGVLGDIEMVHRAQEDLLTVEGDFLEWAKDDIGSLEKAYKELAKSPWDETSHSALLEIAYAIKSQAGIFGYALGTEVGGLLVDYLQINQILDAKKLTVVRKHIDVISVIFRQQIKESGQKLGRELVGSLQKLIHTIG